MTKTATPTTDCMWFAGCHEQATQQVEHPTLGWVSCCPSHIAWLGDRPSPTQFVPPMAAAVLARHGIDPS